MTMTPRLLDRCAKSAILAATLLIVGVSPTLAGAGEAASDPDGQTPEQNEARTRFKRGVSLYENGDYRAALIEFRKAYEIAPNYRVLFNIGQASYELKDYADALGFFERYKEEAGAGISPEREEAVDKWIEQLRGLVGTLDVRVNAEGAEITIDNKVVGTSPIQEPIRVSAGRRTISVSKAGYAPLQRYVDVAGAETATLELSLVPLTVEQGPAAPAAPPPPPAKEEQTHAAPWVALAFTGGFAVATGISAAFALKAKGDNDDALAALPGDQDEINDSERSLQNLAITTDVLGVATILSAGVTVALFVFTGDDDAEGADSAQVRWSVGPTGLGVDGTF